MLIPCVIFSVFSFVTHTHTHFILFFCVCVCVFGDDIDITTKNVCDWIYVFDKKRTSKPQTGNLEIRSIIKCVDSNGKKNKIEKYTFHEQKCKNFFFIIHIKVIKGIVVVIQASGIRIDLSMIYNGKMCNNNNNNNDA